MLLRFLLLWCICAVGSALAQNPSTPSSQASQSQSPAAEGQSDTRPPEHTPEPQPGMQDTKSEPQPEHAPTKPAAQTQAEPSDQAPQAPQSSAPETPSSDKPESKPSEVAPPTTAKPESAEGAKPSTKSSKKHKSKKQKSSSRKTTGPRKVIVRNGGTEEALSQLAPDMSSEEASHARETTTQLLNATESNLQHASSFTLNQDQQAMMEQIRTFMGQSNAAVKAGDLQRGHNLALKALLLSNDLVKH